MNDPSARLSALSPFQRQVLVLFALHWTSASAPQVAKLASALRLRTPEGKSYTAASMGEALAVLTREQLLLPGQRTKGHYRVDEPARSILYLEGLTQFDGACLRGALYDQFGYSLPEPGRTFGNYWPLYDTASAAPVVRISLLTALPEADLKRFNSNFGSSPLLSEILERAFDGALNGDYLTRLPVGWRTSLILDKLYLLSIHWHAEHLTILDWVVAGLDNPEWHLSEDVRLTVAGVLLLQGKGEQAMALSQGYERHPNSQILPAIYQVQQGHWPEAQVIFEAAIKALKAAYGAREGRLPFYMALHYVMTLLAQQTPKHIEAARKFCVSYVGSRNAPPTSLWGLWVYAADVRLGNATLDTRVFHLRDMSHPEAGIWNLFCLLARAWLGAKVVGRSKAALEEERDILAQMHNQLRACRLQWLDDLLSAAEAALDGGDTPTHFFVAGAQEEWRQTLASLQSLVEDAGPSGHSGDSRLFWSLDLRQDGYIRHIEPLEQKKGLRGWGKAKAVSLSRLYGNDKLDEHDVRVARAIRPDPYRARQYYLDRAMAIQALVGHPRVVLSTAPELLVEVATGGPELEVVRDAKGFGLRISPAPRAPSSGKHDQVAEIRKMLEALDLITVLQDSPQRLRVISFTPVQQRAAHLLAGRLQIPLQAETELQQTLQGLSRHFQVQSDHATAAREVPTESRLRAELSPMGDGLILRLVVAPLGEAGPRLMPGKGRAQIMAAIEGEALGTQRALKQEAEHLNGVLDALPFLAPPVKGDLVAEWSLEDPEQALSLVEILPGLPAVLSVDWPKGKPVRVMTVDTPQLGLKVSTGQEWFSLSGEARVDEGMVLKLSELLAWSSSGKGRFVPMGVGVYAALTEQLRARLADLAAVAEGTEEPRIPLMAAAWLEQALDGMEAKLDKAFRERMKRLHAAQNQRPQLPKNLQAELRPYQEDGYQWAMRLAEAGFGACLADDMGLGKTLQALAMLLARAQGGPALVVAPTSVCGNWLAEAGRFAPSLNVALYAEGDRAAMIEAAGPGDVILVSYTLMQLGADAFAGRSWHTLVIDEAQAIKNAAAKRSQAMFELQADFRLALSGTPVENRLAELWSIMRFCNPGLLGTTTRFNQRFAGPIERDRDRDALHLLRRLIAPFVLRRTKGQVLQELPPRTELTLSVVPDAAEAAHYELLRRQAIADAENVMAGESSGQAQFHILAQLTRLRRAACDPRLVSPELGIVGAKVQAFGQLAIELAANGHKTLVFSQFVDFLQLLKAPLDEAGIAYQYLDGATPAAERTKRVNAFQNGEGDLFLISLKAGGFGLNLTAADYVVIADPWWNPAAEDQAMGRAHRIGQLRPVTVYRLVSKGSLEERIVNLHGEKRALAEGVLAEGEATALPSVEDLVGLMRG